MDKRNLLIEVTQKGVVAVRLVVRPSEREAGLRFLEEIMPAIRELDAVARGEEARQDQGGA